MTIGEKIESILTELEMTLLEHALMNPNEQPGYSKEGFRAILYIFMNAMTDKSWELMEHENVPQQSREKMITKCGEDLRSFVNTYTGIDTFELFK